MPHRLLKLSILALTLLAAATVHISAASAVESRRPNILWIMADDHAVTGIGAYGGRLASLNPTPNIDRLAREGVRLTNAFCTNSICTPARATLLTGQYSHTNGVRTLNDPLPPARQTLPSLIKVAGYTTAVIGKWHLHEEPATFDYYSVLPGQGWYANPVFLQKDRGAWPKNEFRFEGYDNKNSEYAVADLSLAWLKKRDASKPFFLMCHFKAPHDNFENAERYDFLYDDVTIPEPDSLRRVPNYGSEATKGTGTSVGKRNTRRNMGQHMFVDPKLAAEDYQRVAYQRFLKKYLRCVKGVDDNVGRLLAHLEQTGEIDNTVIFYTSDQGFMLGEHDYIDKRWMYEESLRVPFIVRYPKTIKPGTTSAAIVNNVDFAETLLDFASAPIPATMQGRSARPVLEGHVPADWPTSTYYRYWMHMTHHDNPAHYGVRTKDYKLIFFYGLPLDAKGALKNPTTPGWELYDLRKDPEELHNVYADPAYAATVAQLKMELLRLKEQVGDRDEKYPSLMAVRERAWDK